jgi:hypothetical protein
MSIPLEQPSLMQAVGVKGSKKIREVRFTKYDLRYIDLEEKTQQPLDNLFAQKCHP